MDNSSRIRFGCLLFSMLVKLSADDSLIFFVKLSPAENFTNMLNNKQTERIGLELFVTQHIVSDKKKKKKKKSKVRC